MIDDLIQSLEQLAVFMALYDNPVFMAFLEMLKSYRKETFEGQEAGFLKAVARFTGLLYNQKTDDWSAYLTNTILSMETCLSFVAATEFELPERMINTAMAELQALSFAAQISPDTLRLVGRKGWRAARVDLQAQYLDRLMHLDQYGTGIFTQGHMFRLDMRKPDKLLVIKSPDPITFRTLYGYQSQHEEIIRNTKALLHNLPCSNLLLYGDAGTGKSASIKAVCNQFADEGLKLIEVSKNDLDELPDLLDRLSREPLKFVLYIDDLSFGENDDSFSALKAILEGSASARSKNTVIYATSNRRHLVKESLAARSGDDVHRRDTMQETLSLSQRFGLCLFFEKPSAQEYLELVHQIFDEYRVLQEAAKEDFDPEAFEQEAEAFALRHGGRSARAARQFVEIEAAKKGLANLERNEA